MRIWASGCARLVLTLTIVLAVVVPHGPAAAQDVRVLDLQVKERQIAASGGTVRVDQGDRVELRVTSDETGELHLHGYDMSIPLRAGETTVTVVQADVAGRFPISSHGFEGGQDHSHGHKVLLYLEVYPR